MQKRILVLLLVLTMVLSMFAGCGRRNNVEPPNSQEPTNTVSGDKTENTGNTGSETDSNVVPIGSNLGGVACSILELKQAYGVENAFTIKPFYNVEQNTEFTFHFNSYVNPFTAVTVHTDSKCEMNSMVYQYNTGYFTGAGMDVVVRPNQPVLNTNGENKLDYGNWGFAPIYYLSINYDLFSTTPQKLDSPIIVPFTVKNVISVPNVEGFVTNDGSFGIRWNAVDNAVKYNIYSAFASSHEEGYTRPELAYVGDFLNLEATVDSNTLQFMDFNNDGSDNVSEYSGYVSYQNYSNLDIYYVTAVDSAGNESFYSYPIEGWRYNNRLPYNFDSYKGFVKDENYNITKLPEVVNVTLKDKTVSQYPISYTKLSEEYGRATYKYVIEGTRLTGEVSVLFSSSEYPNEITSPYSVDTGMYQIENKIEKIPNVSVDTISDADYRSSNINLGKVSERDNKGMVAYTREMAYARADVEAARVMTDGLYGNSNAFTILYDNPSFVAYFDENGTQIGYSQVEGTYRDISMDGGSGVGNSISSIVIDGEVIYESSSTGQKETVAETDDSTISRDDYIDHEIPEEITSENVVEEQIISTEKEVVEANEEPVVAVSYAVFADSAEEEYLARNMIAAENYIDITAFPSLQNLEYLSDVLDKVVYQNPYIFNLVETAYNPEKKIVYIGYAQSKEDIERKQAEILSEATNVISTIITNDMTEEDKIMAIWNYLEENTTYDTDALECAEQNDFSNVVLEKFPDTFNTYGILCKKVGVCQSYAMVVKLLCSMCDVDSVVLTGYLDKNLPHAWNAVNLNGSWYWIDTTNNLTNIGVPYYIYQTSSDYANYAGFIADDRWSLDSNESMIVNSDNSKDFYATHNLLFDNFDEALNAVTTLFVERKSAVIVKCIDTVGLKEVENDLNGVMTKLVHLLVDKGYDIQENPNLGFQVYNGLIMIIP